MNLVTRIPEKKPKKQSHNITIGRKRWQLWKPQRYLNSITCAFDSLDIDPIIFALPMAYSAIGDELCPTVIQQTTSNQSND